MQSALSSSFSRPTSPESRERGRIGVRRIAGGSAARACLISSSVVSLCKIRPSWLARTTLQAGAGGGNVSEEAGVCGTIALNVYNGGDRRAAEIGRAHVWNPVTNEHL